MLSLSDYEDPLERLAALSHKSEDGHDPEQCLCCGLELLALYDLDEKLARRAREILVKLWKTHRPAQGRGLDSLERIRRSLEEC